MILYFIYHFISKGGPSAPINWMTQSVLNIIPPSNRHQNTKILLGLNFFGTSFSNNGRNPIIGNQFIELLESFKPSLKWNSDINEHYFTHEQGGSWITYFPTLKV